MNMDASSPWLSPSASLPETVLGAQLPARILSVDALRGFDMFWIIGAGTVATALDKMGGGTATSFISTQLKHVAWEGFHHYDGISPLFLFLIGISIVLSMDRVLATSGRKGALVRIARRSVLLFVLVGATIGITLSCATKYLCLPPI